MNPDEELPPDERETLPPPGSGPTPQQRQRERRRAYLTDATIEEAVADIQSAYGRPVPPSRWPQVRSATARHLELAWDDGASVEIDLRTAVAILRQEMTAMRADVAVLRQSHYSTQQAAAIQADFIGSLQEQMNRLRDELERNREQLRRERAVIKALRDEHEALSDQVNGNSSVPPMPPMPPEPQDD